MDTSQSTAASRQRKGSIRKLWAKIKTSMKSESSSRASSSPPSQPTAAAAPSTPAAVPTQEEPIKQEVHIQEQTRQELSPITEPERPRIQGLEMMGVIEVDDEEGSQDEAISLPHRTVNVYLPTNEVAAAQRLERAQEVFRKYDFQLDSKDWDIPETSAQTRVEKKPRMRVRHTCHECKATFGRDRKCPECSHQRCTSCIRYPPKKTGEKAKKAVKVAATPTVVEPLTKGACHECKTDFAIGARECANCNHAICEKCLRETVIASPATAPSSALPVSVAGA